MSKAEERALEAFPKYWGKAVFLDGQTVEMEVNERTREVFIQGYEQAEKDLGWHSVDESLPEIDEEVIVLTDTLGVAPYYEIAVGHIIKEANIWNLRGVKFWMPCPKIPNEDVEH